MKGLDIVSDFSKLQLLSNRNAFRILKELQKAAQSGVQLAEKLGMKTPRVIYYLKKLEYYGFARQIAHKPVRGNREKFYCAVAQNFLLSAGLGETDEPESGMNTSLNNSYIDYFLKRDLDLDLNEFARVVLTDYLAIKPEERVVVSFEEQNIGIYIKIVMLLRRIGAHYRTLVRDPILEREILMNLPEKEVIIYYNDLAETVNWANVWIDIKRSAISDKGKVSKKRLEFFTETRRQALLGINEKPGMRAVVISMPRFEERFHTDPDALEKLTMFWKTASVSASEFSIARDIADKIRNFTDFTICTGQDNVLCVSVDREKFIIDAGPFSLSKTSNVFCIPSGEITFVPVSSGFSGSIYMDYSELDYAEARGINLKVENGIVTDCRVESDDKRLEEYFRTADLQEKTVSQVGFGLNPAAGSMSFIPKLDTKIFGSFHLSFGDNRAVGGNITGYTGWDIIAEKPKVISDDEIILNNGKYSI